MPRALLSMMAGIFAGAIAIGAVSVYVFHDVDHDQIGHWNLAFAGLCAEFVLFTLVIGAGVGLLTLLGRLLLRLRGHSARAKVGLLLGLGVAALQYPWEYAGRILLPGRGDFFLSFYLVAAIVICTAILLRDASRQRKMRETAQAV